MLTVRKNSILPSGMLLSGITSCKFNDMPGTRTDYVISSGNYLSDSCRTKEALAADHTGIAVAVLAVELIARVHENRAGFAAQRNGEPRAEFHAKDVSTQPKPL